jgi:hypothetical protein
LTRLHRPLTHRVGLDLRPAAALDRAGDASTHPEMIVGGVDDRVGVLQRNIAVDDVDRDHEIADFRLQISD